MNANTNSASLSAPLGSGADPVAKIEESIDWEDRYQLGDTPWDKGMPAPPLIDFLMRHSVQGAIFIPGCGAGHDVRALAKQAGESSSVIGLDLAESAIALARSTAPVGEETYELGDLFALPASWHNRFDWVVEHTCFCAIPPECRGDYVRAITEVLKTGGFFFAIFFLNPDTEEGPPFGTNRGEISQLFDADFELVEEWVPERTFEGREGRELCQLRRKRS